MRECCGGPKHVRSMSAPKILIPSEVMGEYEEPKMRRRSEPPMRPPGGGLYPLSEEGTYGVPPSLQRQDSGYKRRERKPKVYASYAVSNECNVHAEKLANNEKNQNLSASRISRRKSTPTGSGISRTSSFSGRSSSVSSSSFGGGTSYSERMNGGSFRRSCSASPDREMYNGRPSSRLSFTSDSNSSGHESTLSYENTQYITTAAYPKNHRKNGNLLRNKHSFQDQILCEEDEDELEAISDGLSLNKLRLAEVTSWDSMGILGLTSKLFSETQTKKESMFEQSTIRKESLTTHVC